MNRENQVITASTRIPMPDGVHIRAWRDTDFGAIQQIFTMEGWTTPVERPDDALGAWRSSFPALVLVRQEEIIGFLRALTDGHVTTYIADLWVAPGWRGRGLGKVLLEVCHRMFPSTRFDLLSTESADNFYKANEFRPFNGFRKSYW